MDGNVDSVIFQMLGSVAWPLQQYNEQTIGKEKLFKSSRDKTVLQLVCFVQFYEMKSNQNNTLNVAPQRTVQPTKPIE